MTLLVASAATSATMQMAVNKYSVDWGNATGETGAYSAKVGNTRCTTGWLSYQNAKEKPGSVIAAYSLTNVSYSAVIRSKA